MTHSHIQSSQSAIILLFPSDKQRTRTHTHTHALRPSRFHAHSYTFFLCICLLLFIPVMSSFISDELPAESNGKLRDWRNQECGAVFFCHLWFLYIYAHHKIPKPALYPLRAFETGWVWGAEDEQFLINNNTFTSVFYVLLFLFRQEAWIGKQIRSIRPIYKRQQRQKLNMSYYFKLLLPNSSECICVAAVRRSQGVSTLNVCFVQWLALLWLQIETSLFD